MKTIRDFTSSDSIKKYLFLESFVAYTNELYIKTGKKIKTPKRLKEVYDVFKIKDLNSKRTWNRLKDYPSFSEVLGHVLE